MQLFHFILNLAGNPASSDPVTIIYADHMFSSFRDSSYDADGYSERELDGVLHPAVSGHLADSEGDMGDSDREEEEVVLRHLE